MGIEDLQKIKFHNFTLDLDLAKRCVNVYTKIHFFSFNSIIGEIRWMISDEMAFALTTHSKEITESTLNTVVNHIKSSDDKPGCSVEKIPLGMILHNMSQITIFGHKHFRQKVSPKI